MKHLPLAALAATAALAPADTARAANEHPVAEIVHFRLVEGVTDARFLEATRAMQPLVEAAPGYVSRTLSRNPDGSWTDYVIWTDLDRAKSAAETIFAEPASKPFGNAIDGATVRMRHETILLQLD